MNFGLDVGSIGIVKTLCLTYMNVFMMYVGKLVGMCKLCFMNWQNFVGMCMDIFMGIGKFCGYCGKNLLGM